MKKALDEQLCRKYPILYRDRNGDTGDTSMCWGFACGDGWYTLIDVISELLTKHHPDIGAVQVKEKFGGLCFYHDGQGDYALGVEMTADTLSKTVCESCGAPGVLNNNSSGWLSTLCEEHGGQNSAVNQRAVDMSDVAKLGLGAAWSRLAAILKESADWHTEKIGRPASTFFFNKSKGRLVIKASSDDPLIAGMVDIIAGYANRIDEHTGMIMGE